MLASTPANTPTSMPDTTSIPAPVSTPMIPPARASVAYDSATTTSKPTNATIATIRNMSVNMLMLMPKPTIPAVNRTITQQVNPAIDESIHRVSDTRTASHTSASKSIIARESRNLLSVVTHISMIFITVCWH